MKFMILAGEVSGDSHAAALVRELRKERPALEFFGMGGPEMEAAGVKLLYGLKDLSVLGLSEVLRKYFHFRRIFKHLEKKLKEERPDALILVDFPGFNVRFARVAKRNKVKVIYYVSPQIWAWGRRRRHTIARRVDKMLTLFPFEKEVYAGTGLDVECVGHPSLDKLEGVVRNGTAAFRGTPEPRNDILIGLLPGSRRHEVERLFPILLEAAQKIHVRNPKIRFVASAVNDEMQEKMAALLEERKLPIEMVRGQSHDIMRESDLVLVASGTATLECAWFTTPMLIVYQVSPLTWAVGRRVVKLPHIGLVNVIAGKTIMPEFLQHDAVPQKIADEALAILGSPERLKNMKEELKKVKAALGGPGASARAAQAVMRGIHD